MSIKNNDVRTISLALQGGGSHGAFTWGVLDRLLEEVGKGKLRITALSGTSAGAMNAAICGYGLANGPTAARALLKEFWDLNHLRAMELGNPYVFLPYNAGLQGWNFDYLPFAAAASMAQAVWSPYMDPFHRNPLEEIIQRLIPDFNVLNRPTDGVLPVYLTATDVKTGKRTIFGPPNAPAQTSGPLSVEAMLASACLPYMEQAVRIGENFYWDGGFTSNPSLKPLLEHDGDLAVVFLNPAGRADNPPHTPAGISDRVNEISFNASLIQEMDAIETMNEVLQTVPAAGPALGMRPVRFHIIKDDGYMSLLGLASKLNLSRPFLDDLFGRGVAAAEDFLNRSFGDIGHQSSLNVKGLVAQFL